MASRNFFFVPWNQTCESDFRLPTCQRPATTEMKRVGAAPWRARPRPVQAARRWHELADEYEQLAVALERGGPPPCAAHADTHGSRCSNSRPRQRTSSSSIASACSGVGLAPTCSVPGAGSPKSTSASGMADGARTAPRHAGVRVATGTIPDDALCGCGTPRSIRTSGSACPLRTAGSLGLARLERRKPIQSQ